MQKFSVSKALTKRGVSPRQQGLIYYTCINSDQDADIRNKIQSLCDDVAKDQNKALYEFLTNPYVNHVYICMKYNISRNELFRYKIQFYKRWSDELKVHAE